MESGYCTDHEVDLVIEQLKNIRIHRRKRKNKKFDNLYFPKSKRVELYTHNSPRRAFWLLNPNELYIKRCIKLIPNSKHFNRITTLLSSDIQVVDVYKISNYYLKRQFQLKKESKSMLSKCSEYQLFHFTTDDKVDSIVANNFNWRLSGESRGHKYGYGVCFSPYPGFAEQFCKSKEFKVMFIVRVLVSTKQIGEPDMQLPDCDFDTTVSPKETVFVKFEDSEFFPEYLVRFYRME